MDSRRCLCYLMIRPPPRSTPFPSTTLSRAASLGPPADGGANSILAEEARQRRVRRGRALELRDMAAVELHVAGRGQRLDRKSTRLNSSHANISYAVF